MGAFSTAMPSSPTVRRIYSGTPGNSIVTEVAEPVETKTTSPQKRYSRSNQRDALASPTQSLRSPNSHKCVSPYVRSPSPQNRYNIEHQQLPPCRSTDMLDKSYHQSQKNLRQTHLEEQCSALAYELETLKAANAKMTRKTEHALSKAERMERDHEAICAERDAAVARANAAEEEFSQFKQGDEYTSHKQAQLDLAAKNEECLLLRSQLAQAVEDRDSAYSQLQEHAQHLLEKEHAHTPKKKSSGFSLKMPSIEIEVKAPKMPSIECEIEVEVKAPKFGKSKANLNHDQLKQLRESKQHALIDVFDELDEDGTEFAPRLDLRKAVEKHVPQCAEAQKLADYIRQLDVMIIEKEDYEGFVEQWVEGTLHH